MFEIVWMFKYVRYINQLLLLCKVQLKIVKNNIEKLDL
jgi:hypothetical protein